MSELTLQIVRFIGEAVVQAVIVAGLFGWVWAQRNWRQKRRAKRQMLEQFLRIFGLKFHRGRIPKFDRDKDVFGEKTEFAPNLTLLPDASLQGRAAVVRIRQQTDLFAPLFSLSWIVKLQDCIDSLERVLFNPTSLAWEEVEDIFLDDGLRVLGFSEVVPRESAELFLDQWKQLLRRQIEREARRRNGDLNEGE